MNGEDCLFYARFQLGEFLGYPVSIREISKTVNAISGTLITHSRNVFDKLVTEVLTIRGAQKRTDLELLALKHAHLHNQVSIRWVHSEAQLANPLTNTQELKQLILFYQVQSSWRIVEDDQKASARRRRQQGLEPLENRDTATHDIHPSAQIHFYH